MNMKIIEQTLYELDNVSDVIDILILVYSKNSNNSIVIKWLQ